MQDCTGHTVTEKAIRLPVQISVTSEGVIVTQQDKQQVFGQPTVIKDFYHISTIREGIVSEEKESFFIRLISAQQPLKLVTQDPWPIVRLINQMVSKWQIQQPVSFDVVKWLPLVTSLMPLFTESLYTGERVESKGCSRDLPQYCSL